MAAADSLSIPVVFDADDKPLPELTEEADRLADAGRRGALTPPELSGATFTLSDVGAYGIASASPVIVPPHAAAVATGAVRAARRFGIRRIVPGHTMTITLAADHRILYGQEAYRFLTAIKAPSRAGHVEPAPAPLCWPIVAAAGRRAELQRMNRAAALAEQLRPAIGDERVLAAIAAIPRERFVPAPERVRAYERRAPDRLRQTISQPLVVARMLETLALRPRTACSISAPGPATTRRCSRCSPITSGRSSATPSSATRRSAAITGLEIDNVTFIVGDGYQGLPAEAPFDAINVAAATGDLGAAGAEEQLADGGRLVAPVGACDQHLILTELRQGKLRRTRLEAVRFVPLVHE